MKHTNQLINETSPYLLQHAHNPVNWYPWGEAALQKAKEENKPILVSIGYAACHWCHVMERESFEDEATAAIMNEHFINIKIDREERPDIDHIYMDAVQAMTGSGGWPLNVFLTPDAKPFYGGTYFPPHKAYNRPSWQETLYGVLQAFRERRHEINAQAENLTEHLLQSNSFGLQKTGAEEIFTGERTEEAFQNIMKQADRDWGGFGRAPKFPQTFSIQFLLRYSASLNPPEGGTLESSNLSDALLERGSKAPPLEGFGEAPPSGGGGAAIKQALLSLDKMIEGGIYDQIGGGFARYSTDTEWLVPHFEKMLYDNALLIGVLSEAFQLTKKPRYKEVIEETMEFIKRELTDKKGGFYAALDADSEAVEGKFYVWELQEVTELLGKEAAIFCEYYDITGWGNWSEGDPFGGRNEYPAGKKTIGSFCCRKKIDPEGLKNILDEGRKKLLEQRGKRIRPQLDDKIILGWNALMNTATSKVFAATGEEKYRQLATDNMQFLLSAFADSGQNKFHHTWKNDVARYPAFLDDLAFLIEALLHLQEITADSQWLEKAMAICEGVQQDFKEEGTPFFFYTPSGQRDVIVRKKEVYDGAVPSGNSVMAYNLFRLGILLDKPDWKQQGLDMTASLGNAITRYPTSFGNWACLLYELVEGTNEIAITGNGFSDLHADILQEYIPHRVLMAANQPDPRFPLLAGKKAFNQPSAWLCRNYTCRLPVFSAKDLISLINRAEKR